MDLVIDHNGKFLEPVTVEHPAFKSLLGLLDSGRVWVKLAAPYETSKVGPAGYDDVSALAQRTRQAQPASARCGRATGRTRTATPAAFQRGDARPAARLGGNEATARRILADNPALLYFKR